MNLRQGLIYISAVDTKTKDATRPTVLISSSESSPTSADPIPISITFSESVGGFDINDLAITNGTPSNFAGSGANYTVDVSPTTNGNVLINIAAFAAFDVFANGSVVATQFSIEYDDQVLAIGDVTDTFDTIKVFPNPASSHLQITQPNQVIIEQVRLFDMKGKLILLQKPETTSKIETIDVSTIAKGSYFLSIQSQTQTIIKRVLIQ